MDTVRKITDELAIAGQPTLEELKQLAEAGYRAVVNLRSPGETGFLHDEQQETEYQGLCYINIPIQMNNINLDTIIPVIQQLVGLPQPMLVHCDTGIRSSIVVLIKLTISRGISAEDAFQKAVKLGLLSD